MYGALGNLFLKALPHLVKHTAVLGGGAALTGIGMQNLGGQGTLDKMYKDGLVFDKESGTYKPQGIGSAFLKNFVEEDALEAQKQKGFLENYIIDSGASLSDFDGKFDGSTSKRRVDSLLRDQRELDIEEKQKKLFEQQMEPYRLELAERDRRATEANNLALQQLGLAQQSRADQMLMRADDLKLQRERLAREDQRYNDRLERDERLDREKAFLALMSGGLDALGAAFA